MSSRSKKTRELLLRTAIKLFSERGYANTSIREIGNHTGVSTSVLYHYFRNKEEMLFEVIQSASTELIRALTEIRERVSDPLECLREMLTAHMLHFSLKRKEEAHIVSVDNHQLRGKRLLVTRNNQRRVYDLYREQLRRLAAEGRMNTIDHAVVAFSMFGMINSFFSWYREGGRLSPPEISENILKFVFHGVLKDPD